MVFDLGRQRLDVHWSEVGDVGLGSGLFSPSMKKFCSSADHEGASQAAQGHEDGWNDGSQDYADQLHVIVDRVLDVIFAVEALVVPMETIYWILSSHLWASLGLTLVGISSVRFLMSLRTMMVAVTVIFVVFHVGFSGVFLGRRWDFEFRFHRWVLGKHLRLIDGKYCLLLKDKSFVWRKCLDCL